MGLFSSKFDPASLPDLKGKVVLITGGAAGIGFAVVQHLARRGAKIYIAARTQDRAGDAIQRLRAAGLGPGNGQLAHVELDLADPRVAKKAAEEFMAKEGRLDILINCAAIYIGHFVFTRTLMPVLKRTASEPNSDVRIVHVSSDGFDAVRHSVQFRTIEDFNNEYKDNVFPWPSLMRYCYSKLLIMLAAAEQQRRLDDEGVPILVMTTHPGAINSDGAQKWIDSFGPGLLGAIVAFFINLVFNTPIKGAYSTVFAAAAPQVRAEPRKYRAAYIKPPSEISPVAERARDPAKGKELWEMTETFLDEIGV
ncbi:uncharacterized protein FIBRA_02314 [Fibroporia radiculosa]|uniref:Ketoreductase (KR) domain-containing protein n=1 Tax=Fibroporia radiculosa TaxID=599839 RepID=J4H1S5_9APHY|nr:uncharacterized protein FIBRA_02314 [Fibroporia radiculosa]CCM00284.1 predicted protein [Fibroporia radiculosa]